MPVPENELPVLLPEVSDFLPKGRSPLAACLRHISGTNLYVMPAGGQVKNPLELLNLEFHLPGFSSLKISAAGARARNLLRRDSS